MYIKGQLMEFAESKCPTCGSNPPPELSAFWVARMWDGERWELPTFTMQTGVHPQHAVWAILARHFPEKADFIVSLVAPYLAEPSPRETTTRSPDSESEPAQR